MNDIIIAALVVGIIGLFIGLVLGIASEAFKVKVDENEEKIRALLPGNNCGACGFPGCDGLANAIAKGEAPVNQCPVGGNSVAQKIGEIMGQDVEETVHMTAYVMCKGTCDKAKSQYLYYGINDCQSAAIAPGGGDKKCRYCCLGYGSCVHACPFDAIHIIDGIAKVDKDKCRACQKCIAVCPHHLIEMVPYDAIHRVACHSNDKGPVVKKDCDSGCIGCTLCTKVCPTNAITVTNFLAHIDYSKCTNCGACVEKCPRKIIE